MRMILVLGLGSLLSATMVGAGDAGSIVAALKDKAAQCRYASNLCEHCARERREETPAMQEALRLLHDVPAGGGPYSDEMQRATAASARANALHAMAEQCEHDYQSVWDVMVAQHPQIPDCLLRCEHTMAVGLGVAPAPRPTKKRR